MSFVGGKAIKLSIFGSSHGDMVGCSVDGLPSGLRVDSDIVQKWLDRRRPAQSEVTTQRKEKDIPEIVSGLTDGYTDGGPLTIIIRNEDRISSHYDELKDRPRPGHGDLTLYYKYGEHRNYKGGGFLSGRMTAPLVATGAITMELVARYGVSISSYIDSMGEISIGQVPDPLSPDTAYDFRTRIPDAVADREAWNGIMELLKSGDSVGGTIRTIATGVPRGLGEPFFDSVESCISSMMYSIPGVKGVEFGAGFRIAGMKGSEANDIYFYDDGTIRSESNNNGGVLGGITNGMPVDFRIAMKPTSSIRKEQKTVNLQTGKEDVLTVRGRHDPCIAIRAVPVVQAVTSIVLADLMIRSQAIPRVIS